MPREKNKPPVASTGCSSLMSCLSLQRRGSSQMRMRVHDDDAGTGGNWEQYRKRVQFLEEEITGLTKWLGKEEERLASVASGAAELVRKVEGRVAAADSAVRNSTKSSKEGSASASTKRRVSIGHGAGGVQGMAKLEDGSYLRELTRVGRPWDRLAVQVSRPVIPEDAKSESEVLDKMTVMRPDDLWRFLTKMIPLKDIAGRPSPGEPVRRPARLSTGDDLVEALLFKAMDKMELLVLEGLKIQMAAASTATTDLTVAADAPRRHEPATVSKNSMVHVVLMQARDPKERYDAVGDPMIGVFEASLETKDGGVKVEVQGVHVAGISFVNRKSISDDGSRSMMWSASRRQSNGPHHGGAGDGCRCDCVRNPNRVFRQ